MKDVKGSRENGRGTRGISQGLSFIYSLTLVILRTYALMISREGLMIAGFQRESGRAAPKKVTNPQYGRTS
jgi:hypothetical protein